MHYRETEITAKRAGRCMATGHMLSLSHLSGELTNLMRKKNFSLHVKCEVCTTIIITANIVPRPKNREPRIGTENREQNREAKKAVINSKWADPDSYITFLKIITGV